MNLILSVVLTIIFVLIYMLMIQIFTVLFRITGLTKEKAHFQVISLLTGAGFSTNESELIMSHRSRRKIAKATMITGVVFNVLIASLLINTLVNIKFEENMDSLIIMGIAVGSFILLMIFFHLPFMKRFNERIIESIANKARSRRHKENVITELDAYGKKSIVEIYVAHLPEELEGKSIAESPLKSRYNIIVLLIQRKHRVIDVKPDTMIQKGDKLVVFGKTLNIRELFDVDSPKGEEKVDDSETNNVSIMDNYGANALSEVEIKKLPDILKDKTLAESILKEKYDINVLMVKHNDKPVLVDAKTKIRVGDKVILIGPYQHIQQLFIDGDQN